MDKDDNIGCLIMFFIGTIIFFLICGISYSVCEYTEINHKMYIEISDCLPDCRAEVDEAMSDGKISPNEYDKIKSEFKKKSFNKTKNALLSKKAEKE